MNSILINTKIISFNINYILSLNKVSLWENLGHWLEMISNHWREDCNQPYLYYNHIVQLLIWSCALTHTEHEPWWRSSYSHRWVGVKSLWCRGSQWQLALWLYIYWILVPYRWSRYVSHLILLYTPKPTEWVRCQQ